MPERSEPSQEIAQLKNELDLMFRSKQAIAEVNRELSQDRKLIEFIEANNVQLWPERDKKSGMVKLWTAQLPKPFMQVSRGSVRAALCDLRQKLDEYLGRD